MKKLLPLLFVCFLYKPFPVCADMTLVYFLLSGAAIANGVYMDDKQDELKQKDAEYYNLAITARQDADAAAYSCGVYDAMAAVASEFNQLYLFTAYAAMAEEYNQMSLDLQSQSNHLFSQSRSKGKRATQYEWYTGTSYAAGGILLAKGIWEVIQTNKLFYKYSNKKKKIHSWDINTRIIPGKTEILLTKK
ncbi:MAG: hypothetical protein ABII23_01360, partial [bacterium]